MKVLKVNDLITSKISDGDTIHRVLAGEKELYEILMRRNNQKLFRVIRSYINDREEIEDVMQNTYLKAYEKLYQFKQTSTFSTWLIRIGINESLARLNAKNKIRSINSMDMNDDALAQIENQDRLNPEKQMIRQEANQMIEVAIDALEPKYRTVYMMREVEEMSTNEISDCLEISPSNVKVRLHRAKSVLKEKLYEHTLTSELYEFGFSKCDQLVEQVMSKIL